jgi:hypothetical protein
MFLGFRARMPIGDAKTMVTAAGGHLTCKATTDPRLRECNGVMPFSKGVQPFQLLISSVRDTAAVIVLTATVKEAVAGEWQRTLTRDFGTPNHKTDNRMSESWQWVRKGQMLRLIEHKNGGIQETAVTLTDGPLLDALGPPPQTPAKPRPPKTKKPD